MNIKIEVPNIVAGAAFASKLNALGVCELLSKQLMCSIPFHLTEMEEDDPAFVTVSSLVGLKFVLSEINQWLVSNDKVNHYCYSLDVFIDEHQGQLFESLPDAKKRGYDLSDWLISVIFTLSDIQVLAPFNKDEFPFAHPRKLKEESHKKPTNLRSSILHAFVDFETINSFEETAALISKHLLEGIKFVQKKDLRDEVSATCTECRLLGFWFFLIDQKSLNEPPNSASEIKRYTLEMRQDDRLQDLYVSLAKEQWQSVDLGHWLAGLLMRLPEFSIVNCSPSGSIKTGAVQWFGPRETGLGCNCLTD